MTGGANVESEFVKRSDEAKKLCEGGADSKSKECVPNEEFINSNFRDFTLSPSDFGMENVSNYSSDSGSKKTREPEKVVILNDNI